MSARRATLVGVLPGLLLAGAASGKPAVDTSPAVEAAITRGSLIYRIDKAAWVSTDTMREKLSADRLQLVRGWVVESLADGQWRADYFGRADDGHRYLLYSADVRDAVVTRDHVPTEAADERLSPLAETMAAALAAAPTDGLRCTDAAFNTVVIPPRTPEEPIAVYHLSAQTSTEELPFGGHHLAYVGRDGRILSRRSFTRACVNVPLPGADQGAATALGITHSLDDTPTEIHVFSSLAARRTVYVMTRKHSWRVEGPSITLLDGAKAPASPD